MSPHQPNVEKKNFKGKKKNQDYYKQINTSQKFSDKINRRYCRAVQYKTQFLKERHKLIPYLAERGLQKVCFEKQQCDKLDKCSATIPANIGVQGKFGDYEQCSRDVMFPGFDRCFIHSKSKFISKLLQSGVYQEIISNDKVICDPTHYVQVLWIPGKGYGLFVPHGIKGDYISFMDGPFRARRDADKNYVFQTAFKLPSGYEKPPTDFIDGLQVPIAGRGVMSFANVSKTPNCKRDDQFDKFNSRVWYYLTEDLRPKRDGSLHEITITYNNNFSYSRMAPPIALEDRKVESIHSGFWPGRRLKPLLRDEEFIVVDDGDNNTIDSAVDGNSTCDSNRVVVVEQQLSLEQQIDAKQRACLEVVKLQIKTILNNLKLFKEEVIKICYANGLFGLQKHLSDAVHAWKKALSNAPMEL